MKTSTPYRTEVDIRVAQELKNNQDFIYQTNQSLQKLNFAVDELCRSQDQLLAKFESDKKSLEISYENFTFDMVREFKFIDHRVSEFERKSTLLLDQFKIKIEHVFDNFPSGEEVDEKFNKVADWVKYMQTAYEGILGTVSSSIMLLQGQIKEEARLIRKELSEKPVESIYTQSQIDDMLKTFKVNFDGLVREIALLKNSVGYGEKKFENIYTLIERLKEGR